MQCQSQAGDEPYCQEGRGTAGIEVYIHLTNRLRVVFFNFSLSSTFFSFLEMTIQF